MICRISAEMNPVGKERCRERAPAELQVLERGRLRRMKGLDLQRRNLDGGDDGGGFGFGFANKQQPLCFVCS
ncbi:hypothetical protein AAC387_Pa05g0023 [Persea americana]